MLEDVNDVYAPMQYVVSGLGKFGLISPRLVDLFESLRKNWEEAVQCGSLNLTWPLQGGPTELNSGNGTFYTLFDRSQFHFWYDISQTEYREV